MDKFVIILGASAIVIFAILGYTTITDQIETIELVGNDTKVGREQAVVNITKQIQSLRDDIGNLTVEVKNNTQYIQKNSEKIISSYNKTY